MIFFEGTGEIVVIAEMKHGGDLADPQMTAGQQPRGTLHFLFHDILSRREGKNFLPLAVKRTFRKTVFRRDPGNVRLVFGIHPDQGSDFPDPALHAVGFDLPLEQQFFQNGKTESN